MPASPIGNNSSPDNNYFSFNPIWMLFTAGPNPVKPCPKLKLPYYTGSHQQANHEPILANDADDTNLDPNYLSYQ